MLKVLQILVTAHALVGGAAILTGCGQKGPLYAPTTPESEHRATLPQTLKLWPAKTETPPAGTSFTPSSATAPAAHTPLSR